jgi:hypothetical protein
MSPQLLGLVAAVVALTLELLAQAETVAVVTVGYTTQRQRQPLEQQTLVAVVAAVQAVAPTQQKQAAPA